MRFTFLSFVLFALMNLAPAFANAQVSLRGESGVSVGVDASSGVTATGSADVSATATPAAPLIVTALSARADLGASAVTNASATSSENAAINNPDALRRKANVVTTSDARVSAVLLSSQNVAVTYREPANLFGFIRVSIPVTVAASADGSVRVHYPWYSFLMSSDQPGLTIRAKAAVGNTLSASTTANGNATLTLSDQAAVLDSLHAVLASDAKADIGSGGSTP